MFSHGWPLSADDWDTQKLFFLKHGYRVIAHVATVIYTHSLSAEMAVVGSGAFNFLGVLTSTGAVAFGIVSVLPVELILQVGSSADFAMVFALLIAAIVWNRHLVAGPARR